MSYASKFLNAKTAAAVTETTASGPVFSTDTPRTQSSLFGRKPNTTSRLGGPAINAETLASNPWAAKAAAANGVKIEEKLNFESEKQFPTLGAPAPQMKKGAWGNSTVTAAALAADWAQKDAEEKAAAEAEKARLEEEAAERKKQRDQYTTFAPTRSDLFRQEVYNSGFNDEDYDDHYYEEETHNYIIEGQEEENDSAW